LYADDSLLGPISAFNPWTCKVTQNLRKGT